MNKVFNFTNFHSDVKCGLYIHVIISYLEALVISEHPVTYGHRHTLMYIILFILTEFSSVV